jgi:hypothetical protein
MVALEKGNDYRLRRAQFGRELKGGKVLLSDFLMDPPPEWIEKEPIGRLIRRVPGFGANRMRKLLVRLQIRELAVLPDLSMARRHLLARELRKVGK